MNDEEIEKAANVFNALGSPNRLKILFLVGETTRPLHIKAVAKALQMDYAALYRQVKVLERHGLLEIYEVGRSRVLSSKDKELLIKAVEIAKKMMH
ncbi:winged helix-turn-helix domain-containing protein [Candidatus Bathyarchaeota archaeon]|nr:winged helix-turn-helix domain-containing protein [Candidatus Bathyarchaeota archaeon]